MSSKINKLILVGLAILLIIILIFATNENSLFFIAYNQYTPINWDEVIERNIVRSSIPIDLLSKENNDCIVTAKNFDKIIEHEYFLRSNELSETLKYNENSETLSISCDLLEGDKSRLNIWFVVDESAKHSNKYEYFITSWEEIPRDVDAVTPNS